jgi:hypothetical protein
LKISLAVAAKICRVTLVTLIRAFDIFNAKPYLVLADGGLALSTGCGEHAAAVVNEHHNAIGQL